MILIAFFEVSGVHRGVSGVEARPLIPHNPSHINHLAIIITLGTGVYRGLYRAKEKRKN